MSRSLSLHGLTSALVVALLSAPSLAAAEPLAPAVATAPQASVATEGPSTRWYGWQNALAATPFALTFALAIRRGDDDHAALGLVGFGGYVLASPVVHLLHGHVGKGLASLGLNLAIPLLARGLIPSECTKDVDDPQRRMCHLEANTLFPAPMRWASLLAVAVDAAFLAHEPAGAPAHTAGVVPTFALAPGLLGVGAAGRF